VKQAFGLAALVAIMLAAPPADACGTRPQPRSRESVRDHSSAIVNGTLTYRYTVDPEDDLKDENGMFVGEIVAASIEKGGFDARYPVQHTFGTFYCVGWGWEPGSATAPRSYTGRFFLSGGPGGPYVILRYEP
jgi:hypothetical protein